MDLRAEILSLRHRVARLLRAHVAPRPILAGGMTAGLIGVVAGFYLSSGLVWERPPQQVAAVRRERPLEPIRPMVDANGRVPDYVIGSDHVRGATDPEAVVRVVGPPTLDRRALALEEAGERRWWAPWSWDQPNEDDIRQREADRIYEAREAAREARLAARERSRQRYNERLAQYEREADLSGRRYAYEPEDAFDDAPLPPEPRRRPRWGD